MRTADYPRSAARLSRMGGHGFARFVFAFVCALLPVFCASHAAAPAVPRDVAAARFDHGLLWKIETPGASPSYLFGTIHTDDPRVTALPAPVSRALDGSDRFVMEALLDGDSLVQMAKAMYFSDGRTLEQVVGNDLYAATLKALTARGVPAADVEKQKPWAAMMALSMPPPRTGEFLDLVLETRAARQGKPVAGLETMAEQIAVFDELPMADQIALLKETVRGLPELDKDLGELIRAYLARDLRGLAAIGEKHEPGEEPLYRHVMERLLTRRNTRMAQRMGPFLKQGNAFVAVGAAHLAGNEGLLNLLEQAGYRVTPIY
jgi:uncharacterized protein YbaP (TraB family)